MERLRSRNKTSFVSVVTCMLQCVLGVCSVMVCRQRGGALFPWLTSSKGASEERTRGGGGGSHGVLRPHDHRRVEGQNGLVEGGVYRGLLEEARRPATLDTCSGGGLRCVRQCALSMRRCGARVEACCRPGSGGLP